MKNKIINFFEYAGERALKTFAQTALATIAASQVIGFIEIDWVQVASISGLACVMSILTSIAFPVKPFDSE